MLTGSPQFLDNGIKTVLVDGTDGLGRHFQRDPLVLFGQEKALGLKVRKEPAFRLDIRVGDLVPGDRPLSRNLTYSSHDLKF